MRNLIIAIAGVLLLGALLAQQDAKAFLKQVQQKYRNAKTMDVNVNLTIEFQMGSNSGRQVIDAHTIVQFPNRVYAEIKGGTMGETEIYSDGKTMYMYSPATKQYMKRAAPPSLKGPGAGILGPVGLLFILAEEDLDKGGANRKFAFKGTQNLQGKQVRVVEITENRGRGSARVRLMVSTKDMLIHRVESVETRPGQQPGQSITQKVTIAIKYNSFDKPVPASRFKFTPPKDAKEIQAPTPGAPGDAQRR